jgi:hypothetical protein
MVIPCLVTLDKATREAVVFNLKMFAANSLAKEDGRLRHGLGPGQLIVAAVSALVT